MSANSIHQSTPVTQVGLSQKAEQLSLTQPSDEVVALQKLTPLQREALYLHDIGLNVLPQPFASKGGYPWKTLQYVRLSRTDERYSVVRLFAGSCNLAIMCGRTSNNLFVIDCESRDAFERHMEAVRLSRIPLWAVRTKRGGHIYMCASEGEVQSIGPGTLEDAEIKGAGGYVLGPPSLHPEGDPYEWLVREGDAPPTVDIDDINWLQNTDAEPVSLALANKESKADKDGILHDSMFCNLSRATLDYIRTGQSTSEGERNNALFSAACDLAGNGISRSEAEMLLLPVAVSSGLSHTESERTLESAYSKPRQPARPQRKQLGDWYFVLVWASHQQWSGRTGASARAAILALINRARMASNYNGTFRGSFRELAELGRLGPNTVRLRLAEFQNYETPIIAYRGQDKISNASLWGFTDEIVKLGRDMVFEGEGDPISAEWRDFLQTLLNSDATERPKMGHNGAFLYRHMTQDGEPRRASEWGEITGLSRSQVYYALRKLEGLKVVVRGADSTWYAVAMNDNDLDIFVEAEPLAEARRQRFIEERGRQAGQYIFDARRKAEKGNFLRPALDIRPPLVRELAQFAVDRQMLELAREVAEIDPDRDARVDVATMVRERVQMITQAQDLRIALGRAEREQQEVKPEPHKIGAPEQSKQKTRSRLLNAQKANAEQNERCVASELRAFMLGDGNDEDFDEDDDDARYDADMAKADALEADNTDN